MEEDKKRKKQKRDFDVVIEGHIKEGDYDITEERLIASLNSCAFAEGLKYWAIRHDADILESGEVKRPHFHVVLRFPTRHTQSAVVKYIADVVDCPKEAVSVAFANPLYRRIRYLMHLDELGTKTVYPLEKVRTNDKQELMNAYNSDSESITGDYLIDLVKRSRGKVEILRVLGVSCYSKYRLIISDLWNEKGNL